MSDEEDEALDIFQEPADYCPPEKPCTFQTYALENGREITVRLIGFNPLWGHHLWNGARVVTRHLLSNAMALVQGKTILELGAGAGLPSLICASHGARFVVATDYPDADLISNLQYNIDACALVPTPANIIARGYLWGAPVTEITAHLAGSVDNGLVGELREGGDEGAGARFDVLVLADLLFNHSEHRKLLRTVRLTLARTREARALVFFTPYRPWLLDKDLAFFELARTISGNEEEIEGDAGNVWEPDFGVFEVNKVLEEVLDKVMFEEDRGDEMLRRTVFGYEMMWADLQR